MRQWRKVLWEELGASDRIYNISDPAYRFLTFLIMKQDDNGIFPYSKAKFRELISNTTFDLNDVQRFLAELEINKIVKTYDSHIELLICGSEKNGNLYSGRKPLLYDIKQTGINNVQTMQNNVNPINDNDKGLMFNDKETHEESNVPDAQKVSRHGNRFSNLDGRE